MDVVTLVDLAQCRGAESDPPSQYACFTQAILGNFVSSLNYESLSNPESDFADHAAKFFQTLISRIEEQMKSKNCGIEDVPIDSVYGMMVQLFIELGTRLFFKRSTEPQGCPECQAVTIKTQALFEYWMGIDSSELKQANPDDMIRYVEEFNRRNFDPDSTLCKDVLWITPMDGEVARLVATAEKQKQTPRELSISGTASRLREILGLNHYLPMQHAVGMVLEPTLRELRQEVEPEPVAPTVFDARNYQRFRHWPYPDDPDPEDTGRTYDLNDEERTKAAAGRHGAPEVVCRPLPLSRVSRAIYLGSITRAPDLERVPTGAATKADKAYAEEIARGRDIRTLLQILAGRLKL